MLALVFVLLSLVGCVRATCATSGCISNANCTTCAAVATHTVWQQFAVSFTCDLMSGSCTPNLASGNASVATINSTCHALTSTCCFPGDASSVCDSKTCLVNSGCGEVGQCVIPSATNYRGSLVNCCNSDSDCPQDVTSCTANLCSLRSCQQTQKFSGCCATDSDCSTNGTAACLRAVCLPDATHAPLKACTSGIDTNCACTSNADCDDGSICSTNTCGLDQRCTATFFASSGGASCCGSASTASQTCSNGDVCRSILGCNSDVVEVTPSLSVLPAFTCVVEQTRGIGCCTSFSDCQTLATNTSSPCVAPTCSFSSNTCNINTHYTVGNTTLPCCHDSTNCEPTGQSGSRCTFLSCQNPEFLATNPLEYSTCTRTTIGSCASTDVVTSNAAPTQPSVDGNCTWTCGQPGANKVNLRAKLTNPSSGAHSAVPQYTYFVAVRVLNNAPVIDRIVNSITIVPVSYTPPTRLISAGLFSIEQDATDVAGTYTQVFTLTSAMPIYPDETLTVEISVTFNANASTLTSTDIALDVIPYDICTIPLTVNHVPGTNGTPCAVPQLPPSGDLGNILLRTPVLGTPRTVTFPGTCPALCASLSTSSTTTSTSFGTPSPTPVPTTTTATVTTATGAVGQAGGQAFFDLNFDGFYQPPTEPVAKNLRFLLHNPANNSVVASTNTDANGVYTFTSIPPFYFISVVNATIPFQYQPTAVPNPFTTGPPHNVFFATTLKTFDYSAGSANIDFGLIPLPPCSRATPPSTPAPGIDVEFSADATTCMQCSSFVMLRSKCTPRRCAGLMTRQFIDVHATVSNNGPMILGADSIDLRLNSIGVGTSAADQRSYVCAEAFSIDATGAYPLDSGSQAVVTTPTSKGLASAAFGWKTLPRGTDVVSVHAQFIYCTNDVITHFNITAELTDAHCIAQVQAWNRCNSTIDIRGCQATLSSTVPPCAGCPTTPAPPSTRPRETTLPESELVLSVQPYCFNPLCVNTRTFDDLRCHNRSAVEAQCATALNRGEVLYQAVVTNPSSAPPSEPGSLVVSYQRHAVDNEQLVCGRRFSEDDAMPIQVIIDSPQPNKTKIFDKKENSQTQTVDFSVAFPSLLPGQQFIVSLIAFECSAFPLNVTFAARLDTDRCRDDAFCVKTAPSMPSLTSCVRYRTTGCTSDVAGVVAHGLGIIEADDSDAGTSLWPYLIAGILFILIVLITIFVILRLRRRNIMIEAKLARAYYSGSAQEVERGGSRPATTNSARPRKQQQ